MTSINDSLTSDLLFNIFKRLDCIETTRIRRVCKEWFEIIDEHKSFWRTLHLPEKSPKKWDQSILELFDRKSESSLQDVDIGMRVERKYQRQIFDTLEKSKQSLKHLFLRLRAPGDPVSQETFESCTAVESLRLLRWHDSYKVHLRRRSNQSGSHEDGSNTASPMRVLWCRDNPALLQMNRDRFKNLVFLDTTSLLSSSEWRTFLEDPSRNLKHLKIGFKSGRGRDHTGVPSLDFLKLEVLEIITSGGFPRWVLIPDSAKLIAHEEVSDLPSISELWTWILASHSTQIINQLLKLKTLCLFSLGLHEDDVPGILKERRGNVEAGLQVDGVKMEMIKTVVLPFSLSKPDLSDRKKEALRGCRELVEVVEGDAQSRFIEVEF